MQNQKTRKIKRWRGDAMFSADKPANEEMHRISELGMEMNLFLEELETIDEATAANLRLVFDELGSNVVRHAKPHGETRLLVAVVAGETALRLRISDNGLEFNPLKQPMPYLGNDLARRGVGGLGLYFIRSIFPGAVYRRSGGWNTMEITIRTTDRPSRRLKRTSGRQ